MVLELIGNVLGAYGVCGLVMVFIVAKQLVDGRDTIFRHQSPLDGACILIGVFVLWPGILAAMIEDNRDGPWRG